MKHWVKRKVQELLERSKPTPEFFPGKNTRVGCHFLLQGNLPNPGIEPMSPVSPALAGGFFTPGSPGKSKKRKKQLRKEET